MGTLNTVGLLLSQSALAEIEVIKARSKYGEDSKVFKSIVEQRDNIMRLHDAFNDKLRVE